MQTFTLTLELTPENLDKVKKHFCVVVPAKKEKVKPAKKAEAITKTDIRALATKLASDGKREVLKEIFAKFGAEKLPDIKEEDYPALKAELEAVINE